VFELRVGSMPVSGGRLASKNRNLSQRLAGFQLNASGPSLCDFGHMQFQGAILERGCRLGCIHFRRQFDRG
jgi:hypothetical protein